MLRVIDVTVNNVVLLCFALLCSNSSIVPFTLIKNHPPHLQSLFLEGNETKICSEIVFGINKLQLRPKINENVMTC